MMSAIARGMHRELHARPWVLDDPYALPLVGPAWPQIYEGLEQAFREPVREEVAGAIVARARCAEDRVLQGDFAQYVVLGAGFDSFAWRYPDRLGSLSVIEVDHPATQLWKRERSATLALPSSEHHIFAPVDFETQTLREGLDAAGFDWDKVTLFSWLGVVPYLTRTATAGTLRDVARATAGSEIVISYAPPATQFDDIGQEFFGVMSQLAAASGEPLETFLTPEQMAALIRECGLEVVEDLDAAELHARYFSDRTDGLRPYTVERVLTARVPA